MMVLNMLSEEQLKKLNAWLKEQQAIAAEAQKGTLPEHMVPIAETCWEQGVPYTGAIGGGVTYMITPTSLGTVIKVQYSPTNATLDLTDYEDW